MHATELPSSVGVQWEWKRPSNWIFVLSIVRDIAALLSRRPILVTSISAVILVPLYAYRYAWDPYVLFVPSIYIGGIIGVVGITLLMWYGSGTLIGWVFPKFKPLAAIFKPAGALLGLGLIFAAAAYGGPVHTYVAQAWQFAILDVVEPDEEPTTDKERIWPLGGIHNYARQQMFDTEAPTSPNLVRSGANNVWTMAVEPATPVLQFFDDVEEVISLRSDTVSFRLSRGKNVRFETGERLLFSRNVFTCVRRRMWFWQALRHEPAKNVIYLKNDAGAYVQVVPVIRWAGIAFPRPTFGGVIVIEQSAKLVHSSSFGWLREKAENFVYGTLPRVFWGCGTWIGPDDVRNHSYLVGQNIVPYEVTRFMAASTRFRAGLFAPMPWRREGDVRIADLPDDVNQQPFTLHFNVRHKGALVAGKLYQHVSLEPEADDKQALATALLVPADWIGPSYLYWYYGRDTSCTGVTAIGGYVQSSKRDYIWGSAKSEARGIIVSRAFEHRPYMRDIADAQGTIRTRQMWLSTVMSLDKSDLTKFPLGRLTGAPEIAITDCHHPDKTVWVKGDPDQWPAQIKAKLGSVWANDEKKH